mgnify:CR=1 FL=1
MTKHVHDPISPGPMLAQLAFLEGDFEGEGKYADGSGTFRKCSAGRSEVGGRFLGLRMQASYPLPDGSLDRHSALVMVGESGDSGTLTAHVYTDGGAMHHYHVELSAGQVVFADALPDHGAQWKRARKILVPTDYGFEERLEVAGDQGDFVPFYRIAMHRVP